MDSNDSHARDRALNDDIRMLGASLGRVIRRLEGDAVFRAVEDLRRASRARRRGDSEAPSLESMLTQVAALPNELIGPVARAFALFFVLANTAEEVHRVRRRRAHRDHEGRPQHASVAWLFDELRTRGVTAGKVRELMNRILIRPVLTAHPTETTPSAVLNLQARLSNALLRRELESRFELQDTEEFIEREIELLWLTNEQRERPSVLDEASATVWYLEQRLMAALAGVSVATERAFREVYGRELNTGPRIEFGSWVGGDRDGNPFVTPEITIATARRTAHMLVRRYRSDVNELRAYVTISNRIAPATDELWESFERDKVLLPSLWSMHRRLASDQPLKLKLTFIEARLAAVLNNIASRDSRTGEQVPEAYVNAKEFIQDLELVRRALVVVGADYSRRTLLEPLIALVYSLGFYGYALDVRENARTLTRAVRHIFEAVDLVPLRGVALRQELLGRRALVAGNRTLDSETMKLLDVFRAMRVVQDEFGERAASTYISAGTKDAEDVLNVLLLAREAGLIDLSTDIPVSRLDVVPSFETRDELSRAASIVDGLFTDAVYTRQLKARGLQQEVLIGYSDAAKEVGMLAASWEIYVVQERLTEIAASRGIGLTLFHDRGGAVARGGGSPEFRAFSALPPGTIGGGIKISEQGEVNWQKFGLVPLAERSLEVMLTGALLAGATDFRSDLDSETVQMFRACMEELAETSQRAFRRLVHADPELFSFFLTATPVSELKHLHRGSLPAERFVSRETIDDMPSIDWNFGWTQMRWTVSAWLGAGTALMALLARSRGLELLRVMADKWPFFNELLNRLELAVAEADIEVARLYVKTLVGDDRMMAALEDEYARTRDALCRLRGRDLLVGHRFLKTAFSLRNPYGDVLSLLQLNLLRLKRTLPEDHPEIREIDAALRTTFIGLAQAMRTTG